MDIRLESRLTDMIKQGRVVVSAMNWLWGNHLQYSYSIASKPPEQTVLARDLAGLCLRLWPTLSFGLTVKINDRAFANKRVLDYESLNS